MENNSPEDKQHEATGKRLTDLRRKGSVMRSRDLTSGLLFLVAFLQLTYSSSDFTLQFKQNFMLTFSSIQHILDNNFNFTDVLSKIVIDNFMLMIPVFIALIVAVLIAPFLFGGWNFTFTPVQFNFGKLNPLTNLKNIYSLNLVVEVFKSILKAVVIIGALIYFIIHNISDILNLANFTPINAINASFGIIFHFVLMVCTLTIFLVAVDIVYNYFSFQKKIKMTAQEIKDEAKDSDGSPLVKQKIRAKQYAIMKQRIMKSVPMSTVIITNPTHYSIAVRYDERKDHAPKVLAKGKGPLAQQIRFIAISNAIPIYEAPLLARALYYTTKIGFEISPDLYRAVAIVLTYVHQLSNYQQGRGGIPHYVKDIEIPEDLIYDE